MGSSVAIAHRDSKLPDAVGIALIATGSAALLAAASGVLWRWEGLAPAGLQRAGDLLREEGEVRWRPGRMPLWRDAVTDPKPVFDGEHLFAGPDGSAVLRLEHGSEAHLGPETLVVVRVERGGAPATLAVRSGQVHLLLAEGSAPVVLELGDRRFRVSANARRSTVDVSVEPENSTSPGGRISLEGGDASVEELNSSGAPSKELLLEPGEQLAWRTSGGEIRTRIWLRPLRPERDETFTAKPTSAAESSAIPVQFSWQPLGQTPQGTESFLEVTQGFTAIPRSTVPIDPGKGTHTLEVPGGRHRWRLVSGDHVSPWISFSAIPVVPPRVRGPVDGAGLTANGDEPRPLVLTWDIAPKALDPQVEVVSKADSRQVLLVAGGGSGAAVTLPPGAYQWRVRTFDAKGQISDWSAFRSLTIGRSWTESERPSPLFVAAEVAPPAPPIDSSPPARKPATIELLPTLEAQRSRSSNRLDSEERLDAVRVRFLWKPLPDVGRYDLTVFDDAGKRLRSLTIDRPEAEITLQALDRQSFTYQVAATLPSGEGVESRRAPVEVIVDAPVPKQPLAHATLPPGLPVMVTWEKTALTRAYQVQISQSRDFLNPLVDSTSPVNFLRFTPRVPGVYYWRVMGRSRGITSSWTETRSFTVR